MSPRQTIPKKELIKNDLFIDSFYDDWEDCRDGFRDWFSDFKTIKKIKRGINFFNDELYQKRIRMNTKQKMLLTRRKVRRGKLLSPF
ncbi:hypothetical protein CMO92_00325, partial [Candidatus Woesearchaeota archaeon]|nr:hypothetical protein [Candidatus Woesearchaeota archaeon]